MFMSVVTSTDLLRLVLDIRGADAAAITGVFIALDELNPEWGTIPLTGEELEVFQALRETRNPDTALSVLDAVLLPVSARLGLRRIDLQQGARGFPGTSLSR
jgi:hypothetical protein